MEYITKNETQTKRVACDLAKKILKEEKGPVILLLEGDLGGGKTTFLKGLAQCLGIKEKVLSPTFIIMRKFSFSHPYFKFFYHFDFYRLRKSQDLSLIGFQEIISSPFNIVAIEWPQIATKIIKRPFWEVKFFFLGRNKRKIVITYKK